MNDIDPSEVYQAALKGTRLGAKLAFHAMAQSLDQQGFNGKIEASIRPGGGHPPEFTMCHFCIVKRGVARNSLVWDNMDEHIQAVKDAVIAGGYGIVQPKPDVLYYNNSHFRIFEVFLPLNGMRSHDCWYCEIGQDPIYRVMILRIRP